MSSLLLPPGAQPKGGGLTSAKEFQLERQLREPLEQRGRESRGEEGEVGQTGNGGSPGATRAGVAALWVGEHPCNGLSLCSAEAAHLTLITRVLGFSVTGLENDCKTLL